MQAQQIAQLEPKLKDLADELVQAERAKEEASKAWSAVKDGAARFLPTVANVADGPSHTGLAKQSIANLKTLFTAAGPDLVSKHIGDTAMQVGD